MEVVNEDYLSFVSAGRRMTGKSTNILNHIVKPFVNKGYRAIVVIESDAKVYKDYLRIKTFEGLRAWLNDKDSKHRIIRFFDYKDVDKMIYMLKDLANEGILKDMCIVYEDATSYIDSNPSKALKGFLINNRHYHLDVVYTFHSVYSIPKFFMGQTDFLIQHKTEDAFDDKIVALRFLKTRSNFYDRIYNNWVLVMKAKEGWFSSMIALKS